MIVALALLALSQAVNHELPRAIDFARARVAFDRVLFDAPSARFRDVKGRAGVFCGFVNGKNRLGAYAGWKPFVAVTVNDEPAAYIGEENAVMITTFCTGTPAPTSDRDYSSEMVQAG